MSSSIAGFSLQDRLYHSPRHVIHRALRPWDGKSVIIKTSASRFPNPQALADLQHEYEILLRLDGRGAPRAIGLPQHEQALALIMEDTGGIPLHSLLRHGPLDAKVFIDIALACCDALAHLHGSDVLHRDISPTNVLLDPDGAIRFIDFATATPLSSPQPPEGSSPALQGTPAYMSPEQTGRMSVRPDHRGDYYSLGATFYELLCARAPFQGEDTLDILLAHLGRPPTPLHLQNPLVPPPLSAMVLKLLAKSPAERYQSLRGLRSDLIQCQTALQKGTLGTATIALGEEDFSETFHLSLSFIGRRNELRTAQDILQQLQPGKPELLLIEGPSGIGKSAFAREFIRIYQADQGACASGKFEEFRQNAPYAVLTSALDQHLQSLLSGTDHDLHEVGERLNHALRGQGRALSDRLPTLDIIVGRHPTLPPLPQAETDARFIRVFKDMVEALSVGSKPLLLVLDDIQWADHASLHLLQKVLAPSEKNHRLLILATRRTDVDEESPSFSFLMDRITVGKVPVHRIGLLPLTVQDTTALFADSLGRAPEDVAPLAILCHHKTSGNAYFLTRFALSLHESGMLSFDAALRQWIWRLDEIAQVDVTDNVIDLTVEKISRLSPAGNRILQRAACIGQTFDLATLSSINDEPSQTTLEQLAEGLNQGLIVPITISSNSASASHPEVSDTDSADVAPLPSALFTPDSFRFLHERVRQAAYSLMSHQDQALCHIRIGSALLDTTPADQVEAQVLSIVDHFNLGDPHLVDPAKRLTMAGLNLMAAHTCQQKGLAPQALAYAQAGLACLGGGDWTASYDLTLSLHNEAIEAALSCRDHAVLHTLAPAISAHARTPMEATTAVEVAVAFLMLENDNLIAANLGLRQLAALGFPVSPHCGTLKQRISLARCRTLLAKFDAPSTEKRTLLDSKAKIALRLLQKIMPALLFSSPKALPSATALLLSLASRQQETTLSAHALSRYCTLLASRNDIAAVIKIAHQAWALGESASPSPLWVRTRFALLFYGFHWFCPLREVRDKAADLLTQTFGNSDYDQMGMMAGGFMVFGLHAGLELPLIRKDLERVQSVIDHLDNAWSLPYVSALQQFIENLTTPSKTPAELIGSHFNEQIASQPLLDGQNFMMLNGILSMKMMLGSLFGTHADVRSAGETLFQNVWATAGTAIAPVVVFLHALAWSRDPSAGPVSQCQKILQKARRQIAVWSQYCPENLRHRELLLEAESERLAGQTLHAAELYDLAIKTAHDNGFLHDEALANEIAGDFHEARGRPMIADAYRRQAHYGWTLWGASRKASAMEEQWPDLKSSQFSATGSLSLGSPLSRQSLDRGIDLAAIMKAAQAISGEIHRPALLENLLRITMSTAGAQRGLLFLRAPLGWTLEAEGTSSADHITLHRTPVIFPDIPPPQPTSDAPRDNDIRSLSHRAERTTQDISPAGPPMEHPTDPAALGTDSQMADASSAHSPRFCRSAFSFAVRTRDPVVLDNAAASGPFVKDAYIQQGKIRSLLCLPLFQQADMRGMLYLENNLTAGAFTEQRLHVLELLAAQVVISLDNAVLYENLTTLNQTLESDVAERTQEVTEKSRLLETTLDTMSDGLVVFDAKERLTLWNARAASLFGMDAHTIKPGTTRRDMVRHIVASGALAPRLTKLARQRLDHGIDPFPDRSTTEITLSNGQIVQMRRTAMPDGGYVHIFLDVTQERRRERELVHARHDAEQALNNLQDAQKSLIQAEKMASLGQLVAGVAHEISTPVGVTLTAASFLAEKTNAIKRALDTTGIKKSQLDQFIAKADETTSLMMNNIHRAADLIQSFKQVAVDQTSGEHRPINLCHYLEELLRSFSPMLKKTTHSIQIECPQTLTIDTYPGVLTQILSNLIMNSLTHAFSHGESGTLRIRVWTDNPEETLTLEFSDNGRGIPEAHQSQIFDPFFTTRRGSGGSGLGLNIVYNLVTGPLRGSISLQSAEGKGTTFIVRFPIQSLPASPAPPQSAFP